MNLFSTTPTQRQLAFGLLILRIALGAVFIIHGGQKLFQMGPSGTGGMLTQMGVPGAAVIGPLLSFVEPLAGVGVLLGLLTRLAGLAIACCIHAIDRPSIAANRRVASHPSNPVSDCTSLAMNRSRFTTSSVHTGRAIAYL